MIRHCKRCDGRGLVPIYTSAGGGAFDNTWLKDCPDCNGTGHVEDEVMERDKIAYIHDKALDKEEIAQIYKDEMKRQKIAELKEKIEDLKFRLEQEKHLSNEWETQANLRLSELKKVKEDWINPDNIDWGFLTKIIDMDKKWSPDLLLTLFINYISPSKNVQYLKNKEGGEMSKIGMDD